MKRLIKYKTVEKYKLDKSELLTIKAIIAANSGR